MKRLGLLLIVVGGSVQQVTAQELSCSQLKPANERLACYDRRNPPVSGAETLKTRDELAASASRDFGLSQAKREEREPGSAIPRVKRIVATVKQVDALGNGQRRVTLEDGQVWFLSEPTSRGVVSSGDTVRLVKASLGTFMLYTKAGVALRAKRVK